MPPKRIRLAPLQKQRLVQGLQEREERLSKLPDFPTRKRKNLEADIERLKNVLAASEANP